jgi:L-ascorbate metabolism protein UlaG (beta-lactamase superfamily)
MGRLPCFLFLLAAGAALMSQTNFESDTFATGAGELRITFIGHASLLFQFGDRNVYVDPVGQYADFRSMPKADLILLTHQHRDHFDPQAIEALRRPATQIYVTSACLPLPAGARILGNGDRAQGAGVAIEAVPAYNIEHRRPDGTPFHPRGMGNGYVLAFAGLRVYVAGDTENIPELRDLKGIDVAFLPMNLPYTMSPEMAALAARTIKPRVLYPYHFSETDPRRLVDLLQDEPGIDVRIRKLN